MTEDRGRMTEDRGRMTEDRGRMTEVYPPEAGWRTGNQASRITGCR